MFHLKKRIKSKPKPKNALKSAIQSRSDKANMTDQLFNVEDSSLTISTEVNGVMYDTTCPAYIDRQKGRLLVVKDECKTTKQEEIHINTDPEY